MNELGDRLDKLARRATTGVSLTDPSRVGTPVAIRQPRRRGLALELVAALMVAVALFLWQGRGSDTTAVAAGQAPDNRDAAALADGTCDVDAVLELLRAGIPTYDYDPAGSFEALADQSVAVVSGRVEAISRSEVRGRSYIELTVSEVSDIASGGVRDATSADIMTIAYQAQWVDRSAPDPLAAPVGFENLHFVGFLSPLSGVHGGWAPGPEGLYVSCSDPTVAVFANAAGANDPSDPVEWADAASAEQAAEGARQLAEDAAASDAFIYTIEIGDLLTSIADRFNVTADAIIGANPQFDPNFFVAGEQILIPMTAPDGERSETDDMGADPAAAGYLVQPGDTLAQIAQEWAVPIEALVNANPGLDPTMLRVGDVLAIPLQGDPSLVPRPSLEPDGPLEHEVRAGDDITSIAELYDVTAEQLVDANDLVDNGQNLIIGQVLLIPPPLSASPPGVAQPAAPQKQLELERFIQQEQIAAAAARWQSQGVQDYYLRYSELRSEGLSVLVRGQVVSGDLVPTEPSAGPDVDIRLWTVDDMFAAISTADTVREFEFDPITGAPTVFSLDPNSSVSGDEFMFRVFDVVTPVELERIDQLLADWLPEPESPSDAVWALGARRSDGSMITAAYPLHQVPGLGIYLYLETTQVCIVTAQSEESELGIGSGQCIEKADFLTTALRVSRAGGDDRRAFLLVVPSLEDAYEDWFAEGIGGDLDVTERSMLLTVDGEVNLGQHRIAFTCSCGDQMFTLSY